MSQPSTLSPRERLRAFIAAAPQFAKADDEDEKADDADPKLCPTCGKPLDDDDDKDDDDGKDRDDENDAREKAAAAGKEFSLHDATRARAAKNRQRLSAAIAKGNPDL